MYLVPNFLSKQQDVLVPVFRHYVCCFATTMIAPTVHGLLTPLMMPTLFTHALMIFYDKDFELNTVCLVGTWPRSYRNGSAQLKALVMFGLLWICTQHTFLLSCRKGALLSVLLSVPQMYRTTDRPSQQLRVVLGPLTPILAWNNVWVEPNFSTFASAVVCFLAFGVFRPDNTTMLDLVLSFRNHPSLDSDQSSSMYLRMMCEYLHESKRRRKLHGMLAACNTGISVCVFLSTSRKS